MATELVCLNAARDAIVDNDSNECAYPGMTQARAERIISEVLAARGEQVGEQVIEPEEAWVEINEAMTHLLSGVSESAVNGLLDAGYDSIDKLAAASDEELAEVKGVGAISIEKIRNAIKEWHS